MPEPYKPNAESKNPSRNPNTHAPKNPRRAKTDPLKTLHNINYNELQNRIKCPCKSVYTHLPYVTIATLARKSKLGPILRVLCFSEVMPDEKIKTSKLFYFLLIITKKRLFFKGFLFLLSPCKKKRRTRFLPFFSLFSLLLFSLFYYTKDYIINI